MDFTPSSGERTFSPSFGFQDGGSSAIPCDYCYGTEISLTCLFLNFVPLKKDELWLSPAYGRDSIAIHFTWKADWENVKQIIAQIEARLKPFQVGPPLGKLFTFGIRINLRGQYERMDDFGFPDEKPGPIREIYQRFSSKKYFLSKG